MQYEVPQCFFICIQIIACACTLIHTVIVWYDALNPRMQRWWYLCCSIDSMKQHWAKATTPPCTQRSQIPTFTGVLHLLCCCKSCTLVLWDPNHLQSLDEDPVFSPGAKSQFLLLVSRDVKASLTDSAKTSLDTYILALQLWFTNLCLQRQLDAYILTIVAFRWLKVSVQFGLTLKPSSSSS